ncbi:MAG: DNA polymerase III subunit delta', partial [Persicimonas sp.]
MLYWSDICGQDRPREILERAIDTGRVHHAYLFTGLRGVGKHLTARTLAAVVNCTERPEDTFRDACGACSSCRKIAGGQHPDVLEVAPDGQFIKIDQIREIQKAATRAPYEGRYRLVIIDDAHRLTDAAANALLKTLEEPSERMRLMVITDQPHGLLDTIISRCQVLRFGALDENVVVERLDELIERDDDFDEPVERDLLALAAAYGEGSLGRALSVLKSGMLEEREELLSRLTDLPPGQPARLLDLADELSDDRDELERRLDVLLVFFRDALVYATTGRDDRLVNSDLNELVADYAARVEPDDLIEMIERVREA